MNVWLGRLSAILLAGLAPLGAVRAETDLFAYVTNEWYQGRKDNVLRVAVERLANNPRDVVGLLLMLEYDMAYAKNDVFTNSIEHLRRSVVRVDTPEFLKRRDFFLMGLESLVFCATNELSQELSQEDIDKANEIQKPMNFLEEFKALDDDGLTVTNVLRRTAPALLFR